MVQILLSIHQRRTLSDDITKKNKTTLVIGHLLRHSTLIAGIGKWAFVVRLSFEKLDFRKFSHLNSINKMHFNVHMLLNYLYLPLFLNMRIWCLNFIILNKLCIRVLAYLFARFSYNYYYVKTFARKTTKQIKYVLETVTRIYNTANMCVL